MTQIITFTDANDTMFDVNIEGKIIKLRMSWNPLGFWTLSIWDKQKRPILNSIRVVPNFPLNINKHCFDIPSGEFAVISRVPILARDSFVSNEAYLCYVDKND